jgi:hypothetical protein
MIQSCQVAIVRPEVVEGCWWKIPIRLIIPWAGVRASSRAFDRYDFSTPQEESMKAACLCTIAILTLAAIVMAQTEGRDEHAVRQSVESFYEAFKTHSFNKAESFATEDWNDINPYQNGVLRRPADFGPTFAKLNGFSPHVTPARL